MPKKLHFHHISLFILIRDLHDKMYFPLSFLYHYTQQHPFMVVVFVFCSWYDDVHPLVLPARTHRVRPTPRWSPWWNICIQTQGPPQCCVYWGPLLCSHLQRVLQVCLTGAARQTSSPVNNTIHLLENSSSKL